MMKMMNMKLQEKINIIIEKHPFADSLNDKLIEEMDIIRKVVSTSLSIRKINKIRVRQPLNMLKIHVN